MTIYRNKEYRKVYISNFGELPKDEDGRSYEIHHIDGNPNNNDISNLIAITIKEHYDIHYTQGDWAACSLIASRLKLSPEEKSNLAKLANKKRIDNGTHMFLDKNFQSNAAKKSWESDSHKDHCKLLSTIQNDKVSNGTHNFQLMSYEEKSKLGKRNAKKQLEAGTHNFQNISPESRKNSLAKGLNTRISNGAANHQRKKFCTHCFIEYSLLVYGRYHGDKCKHFKQL
jgi:hypothetical protein